MTWRAAVAALILLAATTSQGRAAGPLDASIASAKAQVDNANNQARNLQSSQQNLRSQESALKQTEADNTKWLSAQGAITQQANDDIASQKNDKPGLAQKLQTLTDADDGRTKSLKIDQDALTAAKTDQTKRHDAAFAAFIAVDPGKAAYAPLASAKDKLAGAQAAAIAALENSPDYRGALADQKAAESDLDRLRKASTRDQAAIAKASQIDMTASNNVEKMRSSALKTDPTVLATDKDFSAATIVFKPTLDKFEADLLTQPDYAAAVKATTDAQNAVTADLAAQKQAGDDEQAFRKQIAALDSNAAKAQQTLKTSAAEAARRQTQNNAIDKQLPGIEQSISNLDQQISAARNTASQYEQQYQSLLSRRSSGY